MFDFTAADMQGGFIAFTAIFVVFQLARDRFLIDTSLVVLHFAFLAGEVNVGVLSAWHVK